MERRLRHRTNLERGGPQEKKKGKSSHNTGEKEGKIPNHKDEKKDEKGVTKGR